MANTPFIQFPCGEWAPGYGPYDEPCDPLIPGDCDDDDDRHPCDGPRCGPGCPDCCVPDKKGKGCDDIDPDDDGGGGPGGPGDDVYIELTACEVVKVGDTTVTPSIKYIGKELVAKWEELVADASCNVVILDRSTPESLAGGGCEVETISRPDGPYSCTTCPCWIVSEPKEGNVACSACDETRPEGPCNPDELTDNMIQGLHCVEEIAIDCFVCDCEKECRVIIGGDQPGKVCPGCKPFEGSGPPLGDCICEIANYDGDDGIMPDYESTKCESIAPENPEDCWGDAYGAHGVVCEFCECTTEFTWKQRCVEKADAQHGDDGGEVRAEEWAHQDKDQDGEGDKFCDQSECYTAWANSTKEKYCFECEDLECEWEKPVGGSCDCEYAGSFAGGDGLDICPDAIYICCWQETYCWKEGGPVTPDDEPPERPCFCTIYEYDDDVVSSDVECKPANPPASKTCCKDGNTPIVCTGGTKCLGEEHKITARRHCVQAHGNMALPGYCGMPGWTMGEVCLCPNKGGKQYCPDLVYDKVFKDCKCETYGDDHIIKGGPCDDKAAGGSGDGSGGLGSDGGPNTGNSSGGNTNLSRLERGTDVEVRNLNTASDGTVNGEGSNDQFSDSKRSAYQINLQAKARNTKNKKTYDGGFNFSITENRKVDYVSVRKDNSIRSIVTEVSEQPYKAIYNTGSKTPREQRTHGSFNIYDDKLNLFNIPRRGGFTPTPNSKWLTIFSETVHKGVQVVLFALESSNTWDEFYVNDLSLSHINRSLNARCRAIVRDLKNNNLYGLSNIDFLVAIRTHILKNTLNQFDISFYENFVSTQAGQPRFAVDVIGGTENSNNKLAVQMAMAYARALDDTAGVGINAQLSKMYRTNHRDKNSRINVAACDSTYSILLNSRNQLPIVCSDGTAKGLTFGTVSSDSNNISIVATDCTTDIQAESEAGHLFRLNALLREKILALLEVGVSDYMESETNRGDNIETDYSLNLDGNNPRQDYYFFKPNYDTTETTEYYNESPLLVHTSRTYTLETDKSVQNSIMANQLGAKTLYVWHDDLIFDHIESSKEIKYYWVDFTLRNFGLSDNSKMPIIATSEIPYIILIPTARSKNNPYNLYSELYINDRKVGRSIKFSLHISREKITSVTNSGQVLEIADDGT